jgi:predicted small integral membrane protein
MHSSCFVDPVIIRLCKTALVATIALFFIVVGFDNLTDYATNWAFVQHVLAMDTIFESSTLKWRAITDPRLARLAYWSVIAWELVTAAILVFATQRLTAACRDRQRFCEAKPMAVLGLTFGLLLYGLGFTIIGGEWFAMWQSQTGSGLDSAARFILLDGVVLLVLLLPEA